MATAGTDALERQSTAVDTAETGAFITPCPLEASIVSRIERCDRRGWGANGSIDRDHC
ncbi:hypothetical protein ACT4ML_14315 [Natrinema sp. LN54]|uniref:hypothetical protein n=1 Tax=Natrinema sp. LN54 TaxID=3458705 RepID=UPI0040370901